jgi:peptidoglycan/LPS O-acetylase OafA/YrhL
MGVIRFLLAMSVVVYHSYTLCGERFVGGTVAVQAFYILSGFYMALILQEKYKPGKGSYRLFLTNRLLRIYPAYWVVLLAAVVASLVVFSTSGKSLYLWAWQVHGDRMGFGMWAYAIAANLLIFGSAAMMFTQMDPKTSQLTLSHDPYLSKPMTQHLLFVPQVWTLGIELCFYLVAPLLVRSKWWIQLLLIALSLAGRFLLHVTTHWDWDPWTYRFFPFELALFLTGSLCYQVYRRLEGKKVPMVASLAAWVAIPVCIWYFPHATWLAEDPRKWIFYLSLAICLPIIFRFTKGMKWDRWIGELSFPLYIVHHLVMMLVKPYFWTHTDQMHWFGWTTLYLSLEAALLLWVGVMWPIDRWRAKRVAGM